MADDAIKQLLAKFTVNTDEFTTAVKQIRTELSAVDEEEKARAAQALKDNQALLEQQKLQIENAKKAAAEQRETARQQGVWQKELAAQQRQAESQAEAARRKELAALKADITERAAKEKEAARQQEVWQRELTAQQRRAEAETAAARRKDLASLKAAITTRMAEEEKAHREKLRQIKEEEIARQREETLAAREAAERRERNPFRRVTEAASTGLFGKGLTGQIAGGVLLGGLEFEAATKGLEMLIDKTKEFIEDSGGLQKVLETYQKLAKGIGEEPAEFMDKLFEATHHLVSQVDLLRTANTFMQSGLKVSSSDMLSLTQATVGLARAQGKDATEALQSLSRAFLTGRAQMLAYVTGIQRYNLQVRNLGTNVSNAQRSQTEFNQVMKAIVQRYQELGEPALTYTDRLQQMKVLTNEMFESMAQGAVKSNGFSVLMDGVQDIVSKFGSLEAAATKAGEVIGDIVGTIAEGIKTLLPLLSDIYNDFMQLASYTLFGSGFNSNIDQAKDKLASFGDVLLSVNEGIIAAVKQIRQFATEVKFVAKVANALITQEGTKLNITELMEDPRYEQLKAQRAAQVAAMPAGARAGAAWDRSGVSFMASTQTPYGDWAVSQLAKERGIPLNQLGKRAKDQPGVWGTIVNAYKEGTAEEEQQDQAAQDELTRLITQRSNQDKIKQMVDTLSSDKNVQKMLEEAKKQYGAKVPEKVQANINQQMMDVLRGKTVAQIPGGERITYTRPDISEGLARQGIAAYYAGGATSTPGNAPDLDLARRQKEQLDKAEIDERKKRADEAFEDAKARIQAEADENEKAYKAEGAAASKYYTEKKALADETYEATKAHAIAEFEAQKQSIQNQVDENNLSKQAAAMQLKAREHDRDRAIEQAKVARDKTVSGVDTQQEVEANQTSIKLIDMRLAARKNELAQETQLVEHNFKEQLSTAQEYTKSKIALIMQDLDEEKQASEDTLAFQKDNAAARLATIQKYMVAVQNAQKQVQQLEQNYPQTVMQSIQNQFAARTGILTARLGIAQTGGAGMALAGAPSDLNNQMRQAMEQQVEQLKDLLSTVEPYSDTWNKIYENMLKATQQLMTYNQQLKESQSILPSIANVFDSLSQQTQGLFGSRFARGLESAVSGVGKQFREMPSFVTAMRGGKAALDPRIAAEISPVIHASDQVGSSLTRTSSTFDQFNQQLNNVNANLIKQLNALADTIQSIVTGKPATSTLGSSTAAFTLASMTTEGGIMAPLSNIPSMTRAVTGPATGGGFGSDFKRIFTGGGNMSLGDAFKGLTDKTVALTNSFGGFVNTIEQSGSAMAGAFAGTTGGAAQGAGIGQAFGMKGGALGAMTGGMAAAGLVFGMISGQKQEQVQDDINSLNIAYKGFMDAFSSNNASLQQTISNLRDLIAQAQAEMAGSKKGASQFQQLINQYNEQINQLENQAAQTMTKLKEQLQILSEPTPYQQMVSNVQQVVEQYAQFVGAAKNASELAQANQFLTSSLQQLGEGWSEQLLQDEQTAVQNALQLNQLLNQRNALQYQYLQQTEQIMGQGTITRQQTQAQSKYAQMYRASVDYANQMMQLNEQIAVAQAQVTAAQQVFQLATTRQGLESQMVALQTQSINLDMARIAAMAKLLSTLQSTGYSITNLAGLNTSDPNQMILAIMAMLIGMLGNSSSSNTQNLINQIMGTVNGSGQTTSSSGSLDSIAKEAYADLAKMGLGGFNGSLLQ